MRDVTNQSGTTLSPNRLPSVRLIIIRHGEVLWGDAANADPPLSPQGQEQARRLAERFRGQAIHRLYSSPMVRALQTASHLSDELDLEPEVVPWLHEIRCPLLTDEEVAEMEARPLERWWEGFPGGEEFGAFQRRVCDGMDDLLDRLGVRMGKLADGASEGPDERVCLVCHAGVTAVLVAHLAGIPPVPWEWYRFGMGFTGVTQVRFRPLGDEVIATLTLFNCRKHLNP